MTDHKPKSSERVSAFVALVSLAGAVIILVIGSIINAGAIVMILAGLIVAIMGAWDSLTRRGVIRFFAAALVLVGLGLVAGGFAWADLSVGRIVSVVALAVLSVGAARFALGKENRRLQSAIASQQGALPANRPVLIMNLKSGGGKAERFRLVDECKKRGIEPIVLQQGDDLLQLAEGDGRPRCRCPRDGGGRRFPSTRRFGRCSPWSSLCGGSRRHQKSLRT